MRIITGKHKYKKVYTSIKNIKTIYRPTSTKTRGAIFNVLMHGNFIERDMFNGAVYADICCGSGSFGLEALSRGAKKVYFLDCDSNQTHLTRLNLESIGEMENSKVFTADAKNLPKVDEKCDVVFIDLPYHVRDVEKILAELAPKGWINNETIVIAEIQKSYDITLSENWTLLAEKRYNKTKVLFLKLKS